MNKLLVFVILLILVVLYFYSTTNFSTNENQHITKAEETEVVINKEVNYNDNKLNDQTIPITHISDEVHNLNQYLVENVDPFGLSTNETVLTNLYETIDESTIENAAIELKNILNNPTENQLLMRELYTPCSALKKRENNEFPAEKKSTLKGEYFLIALQKSGYCSSFGTDDDPFYLLLDLARKGDKLARLFIAEDLGHAISRGLIKPQIYPLEYNDLREEVLGYLINLSATGVTQGTITLHNVYSSNHFLVPRDNLKQYYYAVLGEKQSNNINTFMMSSNELYDRLTDQEKARADRMVDRIK